MNTTAVNQPDEGRLERDTAARSPLLARFVGRYVDRYVIVNGLRLHYTEWGQSAADDGYWLFTGGVIQHAHVWDPIALSLPDGASALCLDLRGQGDSDWAEDGYRLDSLIEDVHAVIATLGRRRPVTFVGHSLGARVALGLAARYPGDVIRIVLSDTGPDVPRDVAFAVKGEVEEYFSNRGFASYDKAVAVFARQHPLWDPVFSHLYAYEGLKWNWADRLIPKADPGLRWITSAATKGEIQQLWAFAAEVETPALLLRGVKPNALAFVADETVTKMQAVMPNLTVQNMNTGHYVPLEDSAAFVHKMVEFAKQT